MKRCPTCNRLFADETLKFCRHDGAELVSVPPYASETPTLIISPAPASDAPRTKNMAAGSEPITEYTRPETRYAKSGEVNIAYQVIGDGPIDLVYVPGWVTHLEYGWEQPLLACFYARLASFSRLMLFDKRGTGLSDQTTELPTLEQRMDDVRAVMEAVGSERATLFGISEGGNMSLLFAATYPERTFALITFGVFAKRVWDPEYPWAPTPKERQKFYDAIEREWGGPIGVEELAPSVAHDESFREWWASYQRRSASPGAARALARMNTLIDVRNVLPAIRVPTLVMHRTGDLDSNIEEGRYIAARIRGAKFLELPGNDHLVFVGDQDAVLGEVEDFIRSIQHTGEPDTVLATVLFTQIAAQEAATADCDADRLKQLQGFYALAKREAEWFKGRVSDMKREGFVATFDGPARAIRCACAIRDAARRQALEIQTGLHTGLCDVSGKKVGGSAVDISAQVADRAQSGEVLVSNTVKDLVSGSGIEFEDRGSHTVGDPLGEWHLSAVK